MYAFSKMVDRVTLSREVYSPFLYVFPGIVGSEDCESFINHVKNKKLIAERFLARHFFSFQQSLEC